MERKKEVLEGQRTDKGPVEIPRSVSTHVGSRFKLRFQWQQQAVLIVLVVIAIAASIISPVFFSAHNLTNVLRQATVLGIIAAGQTIVMISGGFDLSVGSAVSVAGLVAGKFIKSGGSAEVAILLALASTSFIGFFNGFLVTHTRAHPFILTIGMMTLLQGISLTITGGYPITDLGKRFEVIGSGRLVYIPLPILILVFVLVFCFLFLRFTKTGRYAFAIGGSERTAYLTGIKVDLQKLIIYTLNGFFVGVAALVYAARISSALPLMGQGLELQAIAAVVIGGTSLAGGRGSVWGTFVGVLLLGMISNVLNLKNVAPSWQYVALGAMVVFAVAVQNYRRRS